MLKLQELQFLKTGAIIDKIDRSTGDLDSLCVAEIEQALNRLKELGLLIPFLVCHPSIKRLSKSHTSATYRMVAANGTGIRETKK